MKDIPEGGLIGKTVKLAKTVAQLNIPFRAAYGAFFLILAMFPALLLILSCLRYTGLTVTLVYPGFVSHTPLPRETTDRPVDRLITLDIAP